MEKSDVQTPSGLAQETDEAGEETAAARPEGDETAAEMQPLLDESESASFRGRWHEIQTRFVDDPRAAVEQADSLVDDLMQRLTSSFSEQRSQLEADWDREDDVSTENLRVALKRYRFFFNRLLET